MDREAYKVIVGDCLEVLRGMAGCSVDAIVTDPPYGLSFMGKRWDYDVPSVEVWAECLRVLKPGGHLLAFAGTRTQHRMAVRIEDAGFEIRDLIAWVYGSGFPKSMDVSKALDRVNGDTGRLHRFTAWMRTTGITAAQINAATDTFMGSHYLTDKTQPAIPTAALWARLRPLCGDVPAWVDELVERIEAEREVVGQKRGVDTSKLRIACSTSAQGFETSPHRVYNITAPATDAARTWSGWGTALKPALEPITVARKPLGGTVAENVLAHGTGAINVDGCRVEHVMVDGGSLATNPHLRKSINGGNGGHIIAHEKERRVGTPHASGRWPANLIHDGSEEVVGLFPVTGTAKAAYRGLQHSGRHGGLADIGGNIKEGTDTVIGHDDSGGSAARFFFRAEHEKEDLLFCRAKAILSAWKLTKADQLCSQENASVAESSLCLSRQAAVSVLSDAVIAASRGDKLLSDVKGLSTTVTEIELERLCETLITAMLISESVALPARSQDALIQNGCRVSVAAIQKPTDTMTITISLPTSGGYAEPVTFSIIPSSMAHGAKDLSADRFRYCPKASKADRDEGCEGLEAKSRLEDVGNKWTTVDYRDGHERNVMARNHHPTVKPTALMRYLCRLVTPPGGLVVDPFTGSGSTGKAAILEGFRFLGIERDPEYVKIAEARINSAFKAKSEELL